MKEKIIEYFSRHFYPQNIIAKAIIQDLNKNSSQILIDAPCGNGETTWHFSNLKNLDVFGYDHDLQSINIAKKRFKANNLFFLQEDILLINNHQKKVDYFCMINSLFLFSDPKAVLKSAKNMMNKKGLLFVILPNVRGKNYKWFIKNDNKNKLELLNETFEDYFNDLGFEILKTKYLAYTHHYGRSDIKLFSLFSHIYLRILNTFQTCFKIGPPNYYLLILQNKDES